MKIQDDKLLSEAEKKIAGGSEGKREREKAGEEYLQTLPSAQWIRNSREPQTLHSPSWQSSSKAPCCLRGWDKTYFIVSYVVSE